MKDIIIATMLYIAIVGMQVYMFRDTLRQESAAQREKLRDRQRAILAAENAEHDRQFCRERFWREFTAGEMRR